MRLARVRGSGGVTSPPLDDPGLGKEPRRGRVGEWVVPEGTAAALGTSALTRRDVTCAIAGLGLGGSKPVAEAIREGSCRGVR